MPGPAHPGASRHRSSPGPTCHSPGGVPHATGMRPLPPGGRVPVQNGGGDRPAAHEGRMRPSGPLSGRFPVEPASPFRGRRGAFRSARGASPQHPTHPNRNGGPSGRALPPAAGTDSGRIRAAAGLSARAAWSVEGGARASRCVHPPCARGGRQAGSKRQAKVARSARANSVAQGFWARCGGAGGKGTTCAIPPRGVRPVHVWRRPTARAQGWVGPGGERRAATVCGTRCRA